MKRVLFNASNLHTGGAVQVAVSTIVELVEAVKLYPHLELHFFVSSVVHENLLSLGFDVTLHSNFRVLDVHGIQAIKLSVAANFDGYDLIFTIFGPLYILNNLPRHVVGFAQPWIIYPENESYRRSNLKKKILLRLKFFLQWLFFLRANRLVVELQHVKTRLIGLKKVRPSVVDVVNNCVSSIYFDPLSWLPVPTLTPKIESGVINIGYVTRDYPHKNTGFLLAVVEELERISSLEFRFHITLTEDEWILKSEPFQRKIFNVGPISVAQCPSFYREMDAVFFPSLLECFSATPLEAMVMRRPLFASDRPFVRDCCADHAIYFDPLDARSAAAVIHDWFATVEEQHRAMHVDRAYDHVMGLPGARDRADAYLRICDEELRS